MDKRDGKALGDLTIHGTGGTGGGKFRMVTLDGIVKIDGSLECETFDLNGVGRLKGGVAAERVSVNGVLNGSGGLQARTIDIDGKVSMDGTIAGEAVNVHGMLKLKGDCEGEQVSIRGKFGIDGLLNAGVINLDIHARCRAKEIGGSTINVKRLDRRWKGLLRLVFPVMYPQLETALIEGDNIHLEATTAGIVRGKRIYIGPNCHIGRVEYETELTVDKQAVVKERVQG